MQRGAPFRCETFNARAAEPIFRTPVHGVDRIAREARGGLRSFTQWNVGEREARAGVLLVREGVQCMSQSARGPPLRCEPFNARTAEPIFESN